MDKERLRGALRSVRESSAQDDPELIWEDIDNLREVMNAARAYLAILDGDSVVVPREPTDKMVRAGAKELYIGEDGKIMGVFIDSAYRAMIAAHEGG